MTNKGFYGDKLLAVALKNACGKFHRAVYGESCAEKDCKDCEFNTVESVEKWLNAEHKEPEPPLLENGDGLKPGDWIMVRDEDDQIWKKERFLSFANGSFYCIKSLFGSHDGKTNRDLYGEFVCYRQARLPEDGE